jgi:Haemolymph juvenile hormone binding protein (JHBP)
VKVRGYTEVVDGVEYVRFHRIQTKIKIGTGQFYLHNLFNGDATLEQLGNQVINENSKIFLDEIIPGLEKSLSERFTGIVNNIMKSVTLDEMFPPGN